MKYLEDVPESHEFIIGDKKIRNLYGLLFELRSISDDEFSHYASSSHNYFSDWIEHIIKYDDLANELRRAKNRDDAIELLEKKIKELNEPKEPEEPNIEVEVKDELPEKSGFAVSGTKKKKEEKPKEKKEPKREEKHNDVMTTTEMEKVIEKIAKEDLEIKTYLWKHFKWELAKEFVYGMAIGIVMGIILSKIFMG